MKVRALLCGLVCVAVSSAGAQAWNSERALELARKTILRRSGQIADSSIASYRAKAKGYLTFLGQFGDTAIVPPLVVKQTQLAVDVYWRAPSYSKQIVVGMRDTILTPADIAYYSDRFGIVQSNFPDRIRMGDGRDVADVLHPFSSDALASYDFAIGDSLSYLLPDGRLDVYQLLYRPRAPSAARVIGSAMVDVRNGDIVRLDLTFTKAAILDERIEHLTVSLENALIEGRVWLPRRQQIEVVRTGRKFSMEVRGIIRGRWDVGDYDVTFVPQQGIFSGRPIVFGGSREQLRNYEFEAGILDELPPDVAILRDDDVKRIQAEAERLVEQEFRQRTETAALSIAHISDIARINRAEGVALGAGVQLNPSTAIGFNLAGRYGFGDEEAKGRAAVTLRLAQGRSVTAYAAREYADVRDVPEVSGIRNSLAAQEFGSDYTDPVDVRAAGVEITLGRWRGVRWRIDGAFERHDAVAINATPEHGRYEPTIPAAPVEGPRVSLRADGISIAAFGGRARAASELRGTWFERRDAEDAEPLKSVRVSADIEFERRMRRGVLAMRTTVAVLSGGTNPAQLYAYIGGPVSAPGYRFDDFAARRAVTQRVEWRTDVPFFAIPLGRFGNVPPRATLAPYAHMVFVDDPARVRTSEGPRAFVRGSRQGWYPAIGLGFSPVMGLLRFDVARGLRDGRWTFSLDVARAYWPIL